MSSLESTRIMENISIMIGEHKLVLDVVIAALVEG